MKKAVILFIVFAVIDLILLIVLGRFNYGNDSSTVFLPVMFIEIATYGSVIVYDINYKGEKRDY